MGFIIYEKRENGGDRIVLSLRSAPLRETFLANRVVIVTGHFKTSRFEVRYSHRGC
jgi:hypothetical protein